MAGNLKTKQKKNNINSEEINVMREVLVLFSGQYLLNLTIASSLLQAQFSETKWLKTDSQISEFLIRVFNQALWKLGSMTFQCKTRLDLPDKNEDKFILNDTV